ncbi:MAG TPA: SGNH/GDSL hydrolase family protein [Burkholderiaceae bacterium]
MKPERNGLRAVTASLLVAALLAACGGGGGDGGTGGNPPPRLNLQVVSFGDSLSDVGTYEPIASAVNGGRFTTNPGQVWVQDIAQYYGGTLDAAYTIGLTHALSPHGGYGYAEGGATVATPAVDNDFLVDLIGNVEMPVNQQVASYLQAHGSFNANQLVVLWAGANDVLRAGTPPAATVTVQAAAGALAQLVAQVVQNGATHVAVLNLPDIGKSPKGVAQTDGGANLEQLSQLFNNTLNAQMQSSGVAAMVIEIDSYTWINTVLANYRSYGFAVSNTAQACDANKTPDDSALMCSPPTYTAPNADQAYIFADDLHFSTRMHTLLAQYVEQQLAAHGQGNRMKP